VRPGNRCAQGLLARICIAAALEQIEPAAESLEDLLWTEYSGAGGGELDRERQVVEAAAELRHRGLRPEAGVDGRRAGGEEVEALERRQLGDGVDMLAGELEALAARDDELRAV